MNLSGGALAALLGVLGFLGAAFVGNWVSEELRGRLDRLPFALIRLATLGVPRAIREDLAEEWATELAYILHDTEGLPITRLYRGLRYALSLLRGSPITGRNLIGATLRPRFVRAHHRSAARLGTSLIRIGSTVVGGFLGVLTVNGLVGRSFAEGMSVAAMVTSLVATLLQLILIWRELRASRRTVRRSSPSPHD